MHNIVLEERAETPSPASSQPTTEHRTRLQSSLHFLSLASMEIVVKRTFPFFFVYRTRKNHQADALDFHFLARSAPSMGWKWICLLICASSYECFHTLITMIALKKRLRLGFNPLLVLMSENESFVFLPLLEKKLHKRREKADALILHHSQVWTTFRAACKADDNSWFESSLTKTKINKKNSCSSCTFATCIHCRLSKSMHSYKAKLFSLFSSRTI